MTRKRRAFIGVVVGQLRVDSLEEVEEHGPCVLADTLRLALLQVIIPYLDLVFRPWCL